MHILHIYKDYYPVVGGIENHIRYLAEAQVRQGHPVTVLATRRGRQTTVETLQGVKVIKAGRLATLASTPLSFSLPLLLAKLRPDLTHVHMPYPVGEIAQWFLGRRPYVVSYHADVTRPVQRLILFFYRPLQQRFLRHAAAIIAATANYAQSSPCLRPFARQVHLVPYGIDLQRFPLAPSPAPRPPTLLYVGQMRHYKGVEVLLRALTRLPADTRLVLGGQGPMLPAWKALAQTLGVSQQLTWIEPLPDEDLPGLYQSADVFVLPSTSRAESFGIVLLEAMASGLPCVTTEIGSGNSYVVQHGQTGLVAPPRDPVALADALGSLLCNPALRQRLGAAGRQRVLSEFSLTQLTQRIENVYQSVVH